MKDFFAKFGGYLLVSVVALIAGTIFGFNKASDYGADIKIRIGSNEFTMISPKISDFDLAKIPDEDWSGFATKIEKLLPNHYFSIKLRELKDCNKGPFTLVDYDLIVKFIDDENIELYPEWAQACRGGNFLFSKTSIYKIIEPPELSELKQGSDFEVLKEKPKSFCDPQIIDNVIWISKERACQWLKIDKRDLPEALKVKANIICKMRS
ncbi:MAG: hypothetical protein WAK95_19170 [Desulfobacterales bacterium]